MVPGAIFGEECRGDVRIARNGCFTKVSKIGQVVSVGKTLESNSTTIGGVWKALAPQQALTHIFGIFSAKNLASNYSNNNRSW